MIARFLFLKERGAKIMAPPRCTPIAHWKVAAEVTLKFLPSEFWRPAIRPLMALTSTA